MDFDSLLPKLGAFGRYQKLIFVLLCIPASLPCCFTYFNSIFITAAPDHWCRVPDLDSLGESREFLRNLSIPREERDGLLQFSRCTMYDVNYTELLLLGVRESNSSWPVVRCKHGWNFDTSEYKRTLVTEMEIVCDKYWLVGLAETMLFTGGLFGNLFFGWLSDRYGRRKAFVVLVLTNVILGVIASFPPNFTFYVVMRGLIGTTFIPLYQIPFVLALELMSPDKRVSVAMLMSAIFSFGMMVLALVAWLVKDWFILSLLSSLPWTLLLAYWWILPESPRWLLSQDRVKDAEEVVQKIARVNKKKIPPDFLTKEVIRGKESAALQPQQEENVPSCLDMVRYPGMRKKAIIVNYTWICNAVVYIGLSYNATGYGVNDYLSFALTAVAELPGILLSWFFMDHIGRRLTMFISMCLAGLSCLATVFVQPGDMVWPMVLVNLGKLGITGAFSVAYMYAGELFPTSLRSIALSTGSITSSAALMLVRPILKQAGYYHRTLPVIILGCMAVSGGIVGVFLPETLGVPLPQTIEDAENFGKDASFWSAPCCKSGRKEKAEVEPTKEEDIKIENGIFTIKLK